MLLGSLIQAGIGLINSFNNRLTNKNLKNKKVHIFSSLFWITNSIILSKVGLFNLIARGYSFISVFIFLIYINAFNLFLFQ